MKAYDTYNTLDKKLTKLLAGDLLVHKFYNDRYPLMLTVCPDKDPEAQMTMMAADDGASSPDASLVFLIAAEGLRMKINGRLLIDEDLMNKIKNLVKKLVAAYLFGQFAERFTKNGDDINYSGTPEDEDEPEEVSGSSEDEGEPAPADTESDAEDIDEDDDDKMISIDDIPDDAEDAAEDEDEPDPFAEFFGEDAPAEASDDADAE